MITVKRFAALCLALDDVTAVPHMDRVAFRTPRRIFATVAADEKSANLLLTREHQEILCQALPDAFSPVAGGWGRMGFTTVVFAHVDDKDVGAALREAHAQALVVKKKTARATKKPTRKKSS